MKGNQNANMSREEFNNVQAKQVANTAYNGNELYDKGIVRGKIFVLPEEMRNERVEITLNEGYQFVDENGNVINATKIVLEKKKKEYPKTYTECCKILGCKPIVGFAGLDDDEENLYVKFIALKRCRDAYWKIAGEEMGLGKPWKPDYDSGVNKYGIICMNGVVQESNPTTNWERHLNKVLDFPTEEMRDAFYENFKELIEIVKELL